MTPESLLKLKKYGVYGLAIIGTLAILWFVWQFLYGGPIYIPLSSSYRMQQDEPSKGGFGGDSPVALGRPEFDASQPYLEETRTGKETSQTPSDVIPEGELTQRKVIRNGSLELLIKKAEETAENIKVLAERLEGFVQYSQIYEVTTEIKSGTVTIRVPANKFNEAVSEIKKLAVKVESESVNASDVTEQFVDLEARLKNLRAEEEQYLQILKRAVTVEDTLKVTQYLSSVRSQIEQIQGQLQYLSRQVDMSSITVSLTEEADVEVFGIRWRPLFVIKQSFRNMLTNLTKYADAMIGFIFNIPVLLFWLGTYGVGALLVFRVGLWIRNKFLIPKAEISSRKK